MSRPELTGSASLFYNTKEARKYDSSSRMISVQREITQRAMELLKLNTDGTGTPKLILDIGCGSGLSGKALEEAGHVWVGCDVSRDMLMVANERIERKRESVKGGKATESNKSDDEEEEDMEYSDSEEDEEEGVAGGVASTGDLMHHDMGTGLPFRPATFDACISISALQWLCYSNANGQVPRKRLLRFFSSLYQVLRRGGRAVLQFYPETAEQAILISECAAKVGFAGGIVVDYPNSAKAKKHYLVLSFDRSFAAPQGLTTDAALLSSNRRGGVQVDDDGRGNKKNKLTIQRKKKKSKYEGKTKEWIVSKKETQRRKGKDTAGDSKYTGRKRATRF